MSEIEILYDRDRRRVFTHGSKQADPLLLTIIPSLLGGKRTAKVPSLGTTHEHRSNLTEDAPAAKGTHHPIDVVSTRDFLGRLQHENDPGELIERRDGRAVTQQFVDRL